MCIYVNYFNVTTIVPWTARKKLSNFVLFVLRDQLTTTDGTHGTMRGIFSPTTRQKEEITFFFLP